MVLYKWEENSNNVTYLGVNKNESINNVSF